MEGNPLYKLDCATEESWAEDSKYPYRKVVGQHIYTMVYTMVTIMYTLNVLERDTSPIWSILSDLLSIRKTIDSSSAHTTD